MFYFQESKMADTEENAEELRNALQKSKKETSKLKAKMDKWKVTMEDIINKERAEIVELRKHKQESTVLVQQLKEEISGMSNTKTDSGEELELLMGIKGQEIEQLTVELSKVKEEYSDFKQASNDSLQHLTTTLSTEAETLRTEIQHLQQQNDDLKSNNNSEQLAVNQLQQSLDDANDEIKKLQSNNEADDTLNTLAETLKNQLTLKDASFQENLSELKEQFNIDLSTRDSKIRELEEKLKSQQSCENEDSHQIKLLEVKLSENENQIQTFTAERETIKQQLLSKDSQIEVLQGDISSLNEERATTASKLEQLQDQIQSFTAEGGSNQQQLIENEKQILLLQNEITSLAEEKTTTSNTLQQLQQESDSLKLEISEKDEFITSLETQEQKSAASNSQLQQKCDDLSQQLSHNNTNGDNTTELLVTKDREIEQKSDEIISLTEQVSELQQINSTHTENLSAIQTELRHQKECLTGSDESLEGLKVENADLSSKLTEATSNATDLSTRVCESEEALQSAKRETDSCRDEIRILRETQGSQSDAEKILSNEIERLKQELENTSSANDSLQEQLSSTRHSNETLSKTSVPLEDENAHLRCELEYIKSHNEVNNKIISELQDCGDHQAAELYDQIVSLQQQCDLLKSETETSVDNNNHDSLVEQCTLLEEENNSLSEKIASLEIEIESFKQNESAADLERDLDEKYAEIIKSLESSIKTKTQEMTSLGFELNAKCADITDLNSTIDTLNEKTSELENENSNLTKQLNNSTAEITNLSEQLEETKQQTELIREQLYQIKSSAETNDEEKTLNLQKHIETTQNAVAEGQKLKSELSHSKETNDDLVKQLSELKQSSSEGERLLSEATEMCNQLKSEVLNLQSSSNEDEHQFNNKLSEMISTCDQLKCDNAKHLSELTEATAANTSLTQQISQLEENCKSENAESEKITNELEQLKLSNEELVKQLQSLTQENNNLEAVMEEKEKKQASLIQDLNDEVSSLQIEDKTNEVVKLKSKIEKVKLKAHKYCEDKAAEYQTEMEAAKAEHDRFKKVNLMALQMREQTLSNVKAECSKLQEQLDDHTKTSSNVNQDCERLHKEISELRREATLYEEQKKRSSQQQEEQLSSIEQETKKLIQLKQAEFTDQKYSLKEQHDLEIIKLQEMHEVDVMSKKAEMQDHEHTLIQSLQNTQSEVLSLRSDLLTSEDKITGFQGTCDRLLAENISMSQKTESLQKSYTDSVNSIAKLKETHEAEIGQLQAAGDSQQSGRVFELQDELEKYWIMEQQWKEKTHGFQQDVSNAQQQIVSLTSQCEDLKVRLTKKNTLNDGTNDKYLKVCVFKTASTLYFLFPNKIKK